MLVLWNVNVCFFNLFHFFFVYFSTQVVCFQDCLMAAKKHRRSSRGKIVGRKRSSRLLMNRLTEESYGSRKACAR